MNQHDEVRRGQDAQAILDSPIYKEAWASYETALLNLLANADTGHDKAVEIRGWLIAARKARAHLDRIVGEGKMAAAQIEQENRQRTLRQRVRSAF